MTPEEIDAEMARAIDDLEARLRERDAAEERPDARAFALAWITEIRGRGWRPTPAKPLPEWGQQLGPPPNPDTAHRGAELVRKALSGGEVP